MVIGATRRRQEHLRSIPLLAGYVQTRAAVWHISTRDRSSSLGRLHDDAGLGKPLGSPRGKGGEDSFRCRPTLAALYSAISPRGHMLPLLVGAAQVDAGLAGRGGGRAHQIHRAWWTRQTVARASNTARSSCSNLRSYLPSSAIKNCPCAAPLHHSRSGGCGTGARGQAAQRRRCDGSPGASRVTVRALLSVQLAHGPVDWERWPFSPRRGFVSIKPRRGWKMTTGSRLLWAWSSWPT